MCVCVCIHPLLLEAYKRQQIYDVTSEMQNLSVNYAFLHIELDYRIFQLPTVQVINSD